MQIKERCAVNPEQLFAKYQKYVPATINRMFSDPRYVCKRYSIEMDDLIQMGNMGLWRAIQNYDPSRNAKFLTTAINYIRWTIFKELNKNDQYVYWKSANKKANMNDEDVRVEIQSLDRAINGENDESYTFHDICGDDYDDIEGNLYREEILKCLNDYEKEIAYKLERDIMQAEIAEQMNVSRQRVSQVVIKMRDKIKKGYLNYIN